MIHQACLKRAQCTELHGNKLGFTGIERVAGKLIQLFSRYNASFLFTRIEKIHLVAMKFADTLLDSGLNAAVSNFHYGVRFNRLYLAHILESLLDSSDLQEFWTVYSTGNSEGFVQILQRLEDRIHSHVSDERTRQLLLDAVKWATVNPEPLLVGTRSPLDSPNIVALTLLIDELHRVNEYESLTVCKFVHDEQQEFGKHLKAAFEVSKHFSDVNSTSPFALPINVKRMATFDCDFHAAKSKLSFGLQVLDIVLWLMKRFTDNPASVRGMCLELAEFVSKHGVVSQFTRDAMFLEVVRGYQILESAPPLTREREQKGREMLGQFERTRIKRMRENSIAP